MFMGSFFNDLSLQNAINFSLPFILMIDCFSISCDQFLTSRCINTSTGIQRCGCDVLSVDYLATLRTHHWEVLPRVIATETWLIIQAFFLLNTFRKLLIPVVSFDIQRPQSYQRV